MKSEITDLSTLEGYADWGEDIAGFREWAVALGHYQAIMHVDSYRALLNNRAEKSQLLPHEESCECG
jgi:hypothetical protein